jgi:uncharacterized membrane protein YhaH (DUF805 family)
MLSKKFYDWWTSLVLIIIVVFIILSITSFSSNGFASVGNYWLIIQIISAVYWVSALVLAIQLATRKLTKIIDVVVIAILVPLAPIFYFTNLRGSLKKAELQENNKLI